LTIQPYVWVGGFFFEAFDGFVPVEAALSLDVLRLSRKASIRLMTLFGARFWAAAIGKPFCFFESNSCSAAS
jgi:hypothetical protein